MQFVEMQGVSNAPPSKPHVQGEQSGQSRPRKRSMSEPPEKTNKIFIGKLTSSSDKDEIEKVGFRYMLVSEQRLNMSTDRVRLSMILLCLAGTVATGRVSQDEDCEKRASDHGVRGVQNTRAR